MLEAMQLKPMTSRARNTDKVVSSTKLCRYWVKNEPMFGKFGRKR